MEKPIEEFKFILNDIDNIYQINMNKLIYEYKCNCDSD